MTSEAKNDKNRPILFQLIENICFYGIPSEFASFRDVLMVEIFKQPLTALNDLGGHNDYAYFTRNTIQGGVFEVKYCWIFDGLGVKEERTDRRTDTFRLYIYSRPSHSNNAENLFNTFKLHLGKKGNF